MKFYNKAYRVHSNCRNALLLVGGGTPPTADCPGWCPTNRLQFEMHPAYLQPENKGFNIYIHLLPKFNGTAILLCLILPRSPASQSGQ